jgi:hypothetical protein
VPTPEIIERVRDLHRELAETPDYEPSRKPDVVAIQQQIDTILLDPSQVHHYTSLSDRLLSAYVGFEIDHPKIASAMQRVIAAVNGAGLS